MRIYMQSLVAADKPPRFYHLLLQEDLLEGWTLVVEWGNQGAAGRVRREYFIDREAAENALLQVRDAQLQRGYHVVFAQGQEAPQ
ncbi:MAG: WGR domain-containing protein [Gammaproteobacteria bacterium]